MNYDENLIIIHQLFLYLMSLFKVFPSITRIISQVMNHYYYHCFNILYLCALEISGENASSVCLSFLYRLHQPKVLLIYP